MKRKVVIRRRAKAELLHAWDYIARDNPVAADQLVERILASFDHLADWPGNGHERRDVSDPRYRFWTVSPYVVAYRFTSRTVTITRVLHGARDFSRLF